MTMYCAGLPGSLSLEETMARLIRVNQAGEYGAKRIYHGQMAVLKDDACAPVITHMAQQEEQHLAYFNEQIRERKIRPTALLPIWHLLGYALGAGTALLGKKAAMACTVAVEEVIDAHYREQIKHLQACYPEETSLMERIEQFRQEELEHRDIGCQHHAQEMPGFTLLSGAVKTASRLAIWLSKRV